MKKIIFVVPSLVNTGPINVVYNIIKHLDKTVFNPVVFTLSEHPDAKMRANRIFEKLGVEIIVNNYSKWYLQFHTKHIAKRLDKMFSSADCAFHAHGYYPTIIISNMVNRKTMTTIHNICEEDYVMTKGKLMGTYMACMFKRSLSRICVSVAISDMMKSHYENSCNKVNIQTVYNGVDVQVSQCCDSLIREKLNISGTAKVLICPAVMSQLKNQRYIISELKKSRFTDWIMLFAGDGPDSEYCKHIAGKDDRFRFLGFQKDLSEYWRISDFMVSASHSEGLPMAVLEALVQGIPCLLSGIPSHREIVNNVFGNNKMLFDENKEGEFATLLENQIEKYNNHSEITHKALLLYSAASMSRGYQNIYQRL